jgi:hypothetical protein
VKFVNRLAIGLIALALGTGLAFAQETLSGKYEGTAKVAGAADLQITLELKNEGGKISGQLTNGGTTIAVTDGSLVDGKLSLKLGEAAKDGLLTAKVDGDKLTGDWVSGSQKRTLELKKGSSGAASATAPAATPLNLNGTWEAVADANGQPFPFVLALKVDGEKVSGTSSSQLGETNISTGTWKDGRLSFQLESASGVVTMSGTVIDGKLSGEFDFAGQLQGKWVAVKKN